jgi:hypothetical protein
MLPRRCFAWLLLVATLALPFACAPTRHDFLPDLGVAGSEAGTNSGGSASGGRDATGGTAQSGRSGGGASASGGDAGELGSAGEAEGGEGGLAPTAGTGGALLGGGGSGGALPIAGSGGTGGLAPIAGAGGTGGSAPIAGSGGSAPLGGAGGIPALAPTIVDSMPANQASGVRSDQKIVVVFSEPMNQSATQAAFDKQSLPAGSFSWSLDSKTMTYTPSSPLAYATGTAPSTTQAKLYSYQLTTNARSAAGVPLTAPQTIGFTTARQIAWTLVPTQLWLVKSTGNVGQCLASGGCSSLLIGDDEVKAGLRGVFRYNVTVPPEAFVQDVQMYIGITFSSGSVANFGSLQLGKTASVPATPTATGSAFTFALGANGTSTTAHVAVPALITDGSFGSNDLFVAVQWSVTSNNDAISDAISVSDGHLLTHYLFP